MKRLVLASRNAKKIAELRSIMERAGFSLAGLEEFPGAPEPEETGATFAENAVIKAKSALAFTGLPALADDSGLAVEALGGAPGVRSARYAGESASDADNNRLLLANLAGVPAGRRAAKFVCAIALALPDGGVFVREGETSGEILFQPRGGGGFGYDPLFLSDDLGVAFAEADGESKNRVSHRGRALAGCMKLLGDLPADLFDAG